MSNATSVGARRLALLSFLWMSVPVVAAPARADDGSAEPLAAVAERAEAIDAALRELATAVRRRDRAGIRARLAAAFEGDALDGLEVEDEQRRHLETTERTFATGGARRVDGDGFAASILALLAPWSVVDSAAWTIDGLGSVEGMGEPTRVATTLRLRGAGPDEASTALVATCSLTMGQGERGWVVTGLELDGLVQSSRAGRAFVDVAGPVGFDVSAVDDGDIPRGAAAGDVAGNDRNRRWDVFVPGRDGNALYVAQPDGTFVDEAEARGVARPGGGTCALFLDVDSDSDQDLLVGHAEGRPRLYLNDGLGRFEESGEAFGLASLPGGAVSMTAFDYDRDGFVDVFVGTSGEAPDLLLHNVEGGSFEDVAEAAGVAGPAPAAGCVARDLNRDGELDLFVAGGRGPDRVYLNQGDGTFVERASELRLDGAARATGATFGDFDGDAMPDLYVASAASPARATSSVLGRVPDDRKELRAELESLPRGNAVFLLRGNEYARLAEEAGGAVAGRAWSSVVTDFDLDGMLDVFCTTGAPDDLLAEPSAAARLLRAVAGEPRDRLWFNRGRSWFADLSDLSGLGDPNDGRAALAADFDDDGDVDVFVRTASGPRHRLYRNELDKTHGNSIQILLQAVGSHYEACGATVIVQGQDGATAQVMSRGSGFASCQVPELVFGIGQARSARVDVAWPGGVVESFGSVRRNTRALLVETLGKPDYVVLRPIPLRAPPRAGLRVHLGEAVPAFPAIDPEGNATSVDLTALGAGRTVYAVLWSSTCAPSLERLAELEEAHRRGGAVVVGFGLDLPGDRAAALERFRAAGATFPTYSVDAAAELPFDVERVPLPTTLVVDPTGVLRRAAAGPTE